MYIKVFVRFFGVEIWKSDFFSGFRPCPPALASSVKWSCIIKSRGFQVGAFLWWGRCGRRKERKKPKICPIYRIIVKSYKSQAFLSLTLRELPRQREPQVCKPLRLITAFTTSKVPTPGGQGRPPLQKRSANRAINWNFAFFIIFSPVKSSASLQFWFR